MDYLELRGPRVTEDLPVFPEHLVMLVYLDLTAAKVKSA